MQFPKFTSLLLSQSLYFTCCHKFSDDPWEGVWPERNFDRQRLIAAQLVLGNTQAEAELLADSVIRSRAYFQKSREKFAVSCWHMNAAESDAFWRIYSRMDEGIAIRSTVGRLAESLHAQMKRDVYISSISYADYKTLRLPMNNGFYPVLFKRISFQHEQELRAFIWSPANSPGIPGRDFETDSGEAIPIDVNKLIQEVVVSPLAPAWLVNDVTTLVGRIGFSFPCTASDLLKAPE